MLGKKSLLKKNLWFCRGKKDFIKNGNNPRDSRSRWGGLPDEWPDANVIKLFMSVHKHSSLLAAFVNCGSKKFYNIKPWRQC
jgi:hypothetical protein